MTAPNQYRLCNSCQRRSKNRPAGRKKTRPVGGRGVELDAPRPPRRRSPGFRSQGGCDVVWDACRRARLGRARRDGHACEQQLGRAGTLVASRRTNGLVSEFEGPSTLPRLASAPWCAQPGHVLYPTSDDVAWPVASHSEALSRLFRLYTPPIESLVRLLDKARLVEDARRRDRFWRGRMRGEPGGKRRKALGVVAEALCRAVRVKADVKMVFRDVDAGGLRYR